MEINNMLSLYDFLNQTFNHQDRNLSVIKSNLMHKCMLMAEEENSTLDIRLICCQWCLNPLSTQGSDVILQPQKRPGRHFRSLMKRDTHLLNNFQAKLIEKIKSKPPSNTLIFKCHFCSKTTPIPLRKPVVESTNEGDEVIVADDYGRKKKKKKKDKYAGLNIAAVESVKNTTVPLKTRQPASTKTPKKYSKTISVKEQLRMQRVLQQTPRNTNRKTSLLDAFLGSM